MELINRQYPHVIAVDVDEVVHLTHRMHKNFDEVDGQFKKFLQEIMTTVPSVASVHPLATQLAQGRAN